MLLSHIVRRPPLNPLQSTPSQSMPHLPFFFRFLVALIFFSFPLRTSSFFSFIPMLRLHHFRVSSKVVPWLYADSGGYFRMCKLLVCDLSSLRYSFSNDRILDLSSLGYDFRRLDIMLECMVFLSHNR